MLTSLRVSDLALFESEELSFSGGFCALTGETGAGKSLLVDALHVLAGKKADPDLIRTGAQDLEVCAVFSDLSAQTRGKLEELGVKSDGEILISRSLDRAGKNTCRIDGRTTSLSLLRNISRVLLDIHEQEEAHGLLDRKNHLSYLDAFCEDNKFRAIKEDYQALYRDYREKKELFSRIYEKREKGLKEQEFARYQIEELEKARIKVGEVEDLKAKKTRIRFAQKIAQAVGKADDSLFSGASNAQDLIRQASQSLSDAADLAEEFKSGAERLEAISYELEDLKRTLSPYQNGDEETLSLDEIETRLALYSRLFKLYAPDEQGLLDYLERLKREQALLSDDSEEAKKLHAEAKEAMQKAKDRALSLRKAREAGAKELEKRILEELAFLDMNKVRFCVSFTPKEKMDLDGIDDISFLIGTNVGEPEMPLEKIASGGELSRILLALRCVLAGLDEVGTLVFDEIDTGVSGKSAQKIGFALNHLGRVRQVICVTHSAQVAACANTQMKVEKSSDGTRTYAAVRVLDEDARLNELARILGGEKLTDVTLANAKELLLQGQQ